MCGTTECPVRPPRPALRGRCKATESSSGRASIPGYRQAVDELPRWYLIEAVANARADPFAETDYNQKQRVASHFAGALAALRYQGSITQDEESSWYRRMLLGLGYELPDPPPPGAASIVYLRDPVERPDPLLTSRNRRSSSGRSDGLVGRSISTVASSGLKRPRSSTTPS